MAMASTGHHSPGIDTAGAHCPIHAPATHPAFTWLGPAHLAATEFMKLTRLAYYTLERNFRERFGVGITRQQMVPWVEKVAHLLLAVYWLIWQELKAGDYLQIDESPVKVLDPEVKGKAAKGFLWF
jgi:hypothetical protein